METAIVTRGRFESPGRVILEENIHYEGDSFEIIIKSIAAKEKPARKAGTLKGMIHIKDDFDELQQTEI
ncbi:MAG: hypothetical protein BWK80_59460 [Desulfobacteraceae bacterium IS3]|nr:MAG: hypothetical protein BWK80_59460 [Desulfobacteraceae bacterium IS3]